MTGSRGLKGTLRTDLNIIRTISGLALPVRCYLVEDTWMGSCTYYDFCNTFIGFLDPNDCPQSFIDAGISCSCPLDIPEGSVDLFYNLDVPDFSQNRLLSFISIGDFDVKLVLNDPVGYFGCINLKFTMKKRV